MNEAFIRRSADPIVVQQLFDAIDYVRKQRQIANLARIIRYMEREHSHEPKEVLQHLHKAVTDGLIIETITVGCKGSKAGVEQEGYWIPDKEQMLCDKECESHDWYCFACHSPGEVVSCTNCFRVYHPECLDVSLCGTADDGKWICPCCVSSKIKDNQSSQNPTELGRCLSFVVNQQNDSVNDLTKRLFDQAPYHDFFVYLYYDLTSLQRDCQKCAFSTVEEFRNKVDLVLHNYWIMFGKSHKFTKSAQMLIKNSQRELEELKLCRNCFYLSNTKPMADWFCKPCDPPHQVLWAKQKGFDFWPAKVIQVEDDRVDVRFFGNKHPRAWITIDAVRAISVSPSDLRIKRKQHWKQASSEMKEYIRQCECALGADEASKIILYDSPFGIGKNKKLLAAMMAMGKHQNGTLSSLNFDLNTSKSSLKSSQKSSPKHEYASSFSKDGSKPTEYSNESTALVKTELCDESLHECIDNEVANKEIVISNVRHCAEDERSHLKRRVGDVEELQAGASVSKIPRIEQKNTVDVATQTCIAGYEDTEAQVSPRDFDGNDCSCKLRYSLILQKFKDYVVESHRLHKGRIIRAAAFQAAFDQKVVEEQTRKDVSCEFEDIISQLKEVHQKQLSEIKLRRWCHVCKEEASIHCCSNTSYCSDQCKNADMESLCNHCSNPPTPTKEEIVRQPPAPHQRPRRVVKPKSLF